MDRRLVLANERVAHLSLKGQIEAPRFVDADMMEVAVPIVDLAATPRGARERQLLLGDNFEVIETLDGCCFGRAKKDGYCGYVSQTALAAPTGVTHWLASPASHLYSEPRVQAPQSLWISFGSRLRVTDQSGKFAKTPLGFVPASLLRALGQWFSDPVEVAMMFLGTPYLWGGNGHCGIDCSGLVQAALLACGADCPSDSDQQQAIGRAIASDETPKRGDLVFWKGHVGMMVDADLMIHSTGHFMTTVIEPAAKAIARIKDLTGRDVEARRRL